MEIVYNANVNLYITRYRVKGKTIAYVVNKDLRRAMTLLFQKIQSLRA